MTFAVTPISNPARIGRACAVFAIIAAFGAANPTQAIAQQFMSEAELLATLPGSQVSAISNADGKTKWSQAYSAYNGKKRGNISGVWNGKDRYKAKWFVRNGQWCEHWETGKACWHIERVSKKRLRIYEDGKPLKNTWNITRP